VDHGRVDLRLRTVPPAWRRRLLCLLTPLILRAAAASFASAASFCAFFLARLSYCSGQRYALTVLRAASYLCRLAMPRLYAAATAHARACYARLLRCRISPARAAPAAATSLLRLRLTVTSSCALSAAASHTACSFHCLCAFPLLRAFSADFCSGFAAFLLMRAHAAHLSPACASAAPPPCARCIAAPPPSRINACSSLFRAARAAPAAAFSARLARAHCRCFAAPVNNQRRHATQRITTT